MNLRTYSLFLLVFLFLGSLNAAVIVRPAPLVPVESATTRANAIDAAREYRASLKEMSGRERRELKREQRTAVKQALRDHRADASTDTLLLVLITIILPPLGMFLYQGEINDKFWISLLLTLLLYVPGLVYTLITILGDR